MDTEKDSLEFFDESVGQERGDRILKRMLSTPPKEHKELKKSQTKKEKPRKATSPSDLQESVER